MGPERGQEGQRGGKVHSWARIRLGRGLSSYLFVRVTCPSVCVSWTGLSSVRLALRLQECKLGVTPAYVVDTSHSKWMPPKLEYAFRLTRCLL